LVEFEDNFEDCSGDGLDDGWGQGDFVDSIGDSAGDDRESGWNEGGLEGEDASPSDEYEGDEGGHVGGDASPSNEYDGPWDEYVDSICDIAEDDREPGWNEGGLEGEDASPSEEYEGDEGGLGGEDAPSPSNEYVGHEDGHEGEDAPSPSSEHEGLWDQYEGDEGDHVEEVAPPSNEYKGSWDEYEGDHAREGSWNEYEGGHEDEGAPWGEHESPCTAHNFYDRMASGIASGRWPTLSDVRRLLDDCGRIALISSKPTALRYQPKYPGERSPHNAMSGQFFSFDLQVRVLSHFIPRCAVRFYRLNGNGDSAIDGLWLHDFNLDTPCERTIKVVQERLWRSD